MSEQTRKCDWAFCKNKAAFRMGRFRLCRKHSAKNLHPSDLRDQIAALNTEEPHSEQVHAVDGVRIEDSKSWMGGSGMRRSRNTEEPNA